MKVWRLEFLNVIHEETIGKIGINMLVQLPAVRVYQGCRGREQADPGESSKAAASRNLLERFLDAVLIAPEPGPKAPDPEDRQQSESEQKSAVHIHPDQHGDGQKP